MNFHEVYLSGLCKQAYIRQWLKQVSSHVANLEFDGINPCKSLIGGRGCLSANVDLSCELRAVRSLSGVKVSMLAFMIKAACATLAKFPEFNASLDGNMRRAIDLREGDKLNAAVNAALTRPPVQLSATDNV